MDEIVILYCIFRQCFSKVSLYMQTRSETIAIKRFRLVSKISIVPVSSLVTLFSPRFMHNCCVKCDQIHNVNSKPQKEVCLAEEEKVETRLTELAFLYVTNTGQVLLLLV